MVKVNVEQVEPELNDLRDSFATLACMLTKGTVREVRYCNRLPIGVT